MRFHADRTRCLTTCGLLLSTNLQHRVPNKCCPCPALLIPPSQVGFPRRDPGRLTLALANTYRTVWVRAARKSRLAKQGQVRWGAGVSDIYIRGMGGSTRCCTEQPQPSCWDLHWGVHVSGDAPTAHLPHPFRLLTRPLPSFAPLQLLGFARATSDGALSAVIWDVSVAPAWQRSGLGRAMMERLTASLVHDGIATITLYAGGSCARRAAGCSVMLTSLPVAAGGRCGQPLPQARPVTTPISPHPPALLPSRAQRGGPVREAGLCGGPRWSAGRGLPAVQAGTGPRLGSAGAAMSLQGVPAAGCSPTLQWSAAHHPIRVYHTH